MPGRERYRQVFHRRYDMKDLTKLTYDELLASIAQLVKDEESGRVPYEDVSHRFPKYVPFPMEPDQVVAVMIRRGTKKER
jgi:hypothetical protein